MVSRKRVLLGLFLFGSLSCVLSTDAEARRCRRGKCNYNYTYYNYTVKKDKHPDQTVNSIVPTLEEDSQKKKILVRINEYRVSKGKQILTDEKVDSFLNE